MTNFEYVKQKLADVTRDELEKRVVRDNVCPPLYESRCTLDVDGDMAVTCSFCWKTWMSQETGCGQTNFDIIKERMAEATMEQVIRAMDGCCPPGCEEKPCPPCDCCDCWEQWLKQETEEDISK